MADDTTAIETGTADREPALAAPAPAPETAQAPSAGQAGSAGQLAGQLPGQAASEARPASRFARISGFAATARGRVRPALAATLLLGLGAGAAAGAAGTLLLRGSDHGAAEWRRMAARLEGGHADLGRLAVDVKLMREQVAALKDGGRTGPVLERLDRLQRTEQEVAAKVSALAERIERSDKDDAQRIAALGERLEKRLAAVPAPAPVAAAPAAPKAAPPDTVAMTGSLPEAKPAPAVLPGWTLREVYDGVAMVESRNQRLLEVAPGSTLPGGGRVEAIERRGKNWVVVTSRGTIVSQAW